MLKTFEGTLSKPTGIVNLTCEFKNTIVYEDFVILEGANQILLGRQACVYLKLVKRINNATKYEIPPEKEQFINQNVDIFSGSDLFDEEVEKYFGNIENIIICHDDSIAAGTTIEEHDRAVAQIIQKATETGAKFKKEKFEYCENLWVK
ncbi:hypothetical protein ILUMI_08959 [Ignelater luminosus]|uniref:Uncharacterized protein n=1 Tax=Ignelater luminosus TaxID=2038154 RepID=A0A8K0D6P7_IGNLU|nr:hypothetical protein ILUMI_08959 [Ignelater luminosus]